VTAYTPPPHGFRTFLILWVSQSVSVFGSALTFFAVTIWLTQVRFPSAEQRPALAAALSAVSLAFALPNVFSAPIAGAWADRHDRRNTMRISDLANGAISVALLVLMYLGVLEVWMLVVLVAASSIVASFHFSAFDTSYAMIVPEKQLPRANGMMQTIWSLSGILSPGLAAAIISLPALARQGDWPGRLAAWLAGFQDGSVLAIGLDVLTFLFAALVISFLFIPSPHRSDLAAAGAPRPSLWGDVTLGAAYIWNRRPLLWLLGTFTLANFASAPVEVFQPLMVKFNLAEDWGARGFTLETALALLVSVGSVGGVSGGIAISTWGGLKRRRVYGVVIPLIATGVAQLVFGLSDVLFLTAAMAFVIHGTIPLMNSHSQAIWQTQTPRELQGRVFSVRRLIAQFTWPLGTVLAGWSGGRFDPGVVLAILGGVLAIFCLGQLFNPHLLRVEDKTYLDAMADAAGRPPTPPSEKAAAEV
jgi:MFS family permease